jgi:nitroimidazol reductase NimA-like FMN-containing flavoprotein (pyridoxamine 5'-phosphate oxidase superfamily)
VTDQPAKPRSVRMTTDEAWEFVEAAHTGIFTTLRRDGYPIALPVWFVTLDRRIYIVTRGKKVLRARHDARCSLLVEAGERWAELRAVHLTCRAEVIEPDGALDRRISEEMARKYTAFQTPSTAMPEETKQHYAKTMGTIIELVPDERILSWDNNHLGI